MGSVVAWILWLGFPDGRDWVPYSVTSGIKNELPRPDRATGSHPGHILLIVWGLQSGLNVHRIPWSTILLCRWGRPRAVFSVHVPLQAELWDGPSSILCILVKLPGPAGWRLH